MTDLRKILQLPLTKLKVILALLKKSGYIEARQRKSAYGLTEAVRKNRDLVLNLANYETKKSYDQSKLAMMLQYAETTVVPPPLHLELLRRRLRTGQLRRVRQLPARRCDARRRTNARRTGGSASPTSSPIRSSARHGRARRERLGDRAVPERRLQNAAGIGGAPCRSAKSRERWTHSLAAPLIAAACLLSCHGRNARKHAVPSPRRALAARPRTRSASAAARSSPAPWPAPTPPPITVSPPRPPFRSAPR